MWKTLKSHPWWIAFSVAMLVLAGWLIYSTFLAKPETPVLKCYNKADLVYSDDIPVGKNIVAISAKRGINMDGLLKAIESALNHARHHIVVRLPYAMGGMVETLHDGAQVKKVDYTPEGIEIEAVVDGILYGRLREYIIGEC